MAKIIVISPQDDEIEAAVNKALGDHEVIFVAPSPANFLHLCLGMLPDDPNDGITSADIKNSDETTDDVEAAAAEEEPAEKEKKKAEPEEEEPVKESFVSECSIHGEIIEVVITENDSTTLTTSIDRVNHNNGNDKVTYKLNEMTISGWVNSPEQTLNEQLSITVNNRQFNILVPLLESVDGATRLLVGKDLISQFSSNDN